MSIMQARGADRRKMRGVPVIQPNAAGVSRAAYRRTLRTGREWLPHNVCDFMFHAGVSVDDAMQLVQAYSSRPYEIAA